MSNILIIGGCGYIGSELHQHLKNNRRRIDTLDTEYFGNFNNPSNIKCDYKDVTPEFLSSYETIIHLAAHSSVQMSENDPIGAFFNNASNMFEFLNKLNGQKLIYASSSSVYNGSSEELASEDTVAGQNFSNIYDISKFTFDAIISNYYENYFGLRLGTVCGSSSNLRTDVMINKMVATAFEKKIIEIYNPDIHRPILAMTDLCLAINKMVDCDKNIPRGIYNLSSFNSTIKDIGIIVAKLVGAKMEIKGNTTAYDFMISSEKFNECFGATLNSSIEDIVKELVNNWSNINKSVRI